MTKYLCALVASVLLSGCASNVEVAYPVAPVASETGDILVRFSEPMRAVSVTIDGRLVVEDRHTSRIFIDDVPTGERHVAIVAASSGRTEPLNHREVVDLGAGTEASVLVATPPHSLGYWISSAVTVLAYGAVLLTSDLIR